MELFNPIHSLLPVILKRLQNEYEASQFYRNAANWCANAGYMKAAAYFSNEAVSEQEHAIKLQTFMNDWGCRYVLPQISTVFACTSLPEIVRKAYEGFEVPLYKAYNDDAGRAFDIDKSAFTLLLEFVEKQRKSVAEYRTLIDKLMLIDESNKLDVYLYELNAF
jgi:ferritin